MYYIDRNHVDSEEWMRGDEMGRTPMVVITDTGLVEVFSWNSKKRS